MIFILLLAASCGKKGNDPVEILTNVYQNQKDLSSYTADMTIDVNFGTGDGSTMSIPVDMTIMYDNRNSKDAADDRVYLDMGTDVLGQSLHYEIWIKDGKIYTDDGTNKSVSEAENYADMMQSIKDVDVADTVKKLTQNLESFTANKKDKGFELVLKPKETLLSDLLSSSAFSNLDQFENYDLDSLKEIMKGLKMSDIVMTIDENQLLKDMNTSFSMKYDEFDLLADLSMRFYDYNKTSLPVLDESAFVDGSSEPIDIGTDDTIDDSFLDGSYIDIIFDDNATEIYVFMSDTDRYAIYYDEEDYFIEIYDGNDDVCDGLFLDKDFTEEMLDEIQSHPKDFTIRSTGTVDATFTDGSILIGVSNTDNDYFNPDTPFSVITFDGCQYAIVFVGYETEEAFKAIMDQTTYMIYIQE